MGDTQPRVPSSFKDQRYRAFVLRMWQSADENWRIMLENIHTGERNTFTSLEKLMIFLQDKQEDAV